MTYENRYVAFMDILGFSEIVRATENDTRDERYEALAKTLAAIGKRDPDFDKLFGDDFKMQTFSDSIVMSEKASLAGFLQLVDSVRDLTLRLLESGLFLRGAIARGKLHHDGNIMFGPAFLEAYGIESTIAKFPRVIFSRGVYEDLASFRKTKQLTNASEYCRSADDGPPFVHVLSQIEKLNVLANDVENNNSPAATQAQACQRVLQQLLRTSIHHPNHYEKVRWFGIYWNETVGFVPDALVGPVKFPGWQTLSWQVS